MNTAPNPPVNEVESFVQGLLAAPSPVAQNPAAVAETIRNPAPPSPALMPDAISRLFQPVESIDLAPAAAKLMRGISFEIGGQVYALEVGTLLEVLSGVEIMPVPGTIRDVLGVVNLRGSIVTVIDPHRSLGLPAENEPADRDGKEKTLVVADHRGHPVALEVRRVIEVVQLAESSLQPAPHTRGPIKALASHRGDLLTLLDLDALVSAIFPSEKQA